MAGMANAVAGMNLEESTALENTSQPSTLTPPPPLNADLREQIDAFLNGLASEGTRKVYKRGTEGYVKFWEAHGHCNVQVDARGVAQFLRANAGKGYTVLNGYMKGLVDFQKYWCRQNDLLCPPLRQDREISDILKSSRQASVERAQSTQMAQEAQGEGTNVTIAGAEVDDGHAEPESTGVQGSVVADELQATCPYYTDRQLVEMSKHWLQSASASGTESSREKIYEAIQVRASVLLYDKCLGYAEAVRQAQLCDMFEFTVESFYPDNGRVLAVYAYNGNQKKRESGYVGVIRARDYLVCPVFAVALALFARWEWMKRKRPDFSSRRSWYLMPLFEEAGENAGISPKTENLYVKAAFQSVGLKKSKKMIAKYQDEKARNTEWIQRGGFFGNLWQLDDWCQTRRLGHPHLPILTAAGFLEDLYVVPRSHVEPPASLVRLVWPWLDEELRAKVQRNKVCSSQESDKAATQFMKALRWLRTLFLQDAALLQRAFPNLPIFSHGVFKHRDWPAFATQLRKMHDGNDPGVLPAVVTMEMKAMLRKLENMKMDMDFMLAKVREQTGEVKAARTRLMLRQYDAGCNARQMLIEVGKAIGPLAGLTCSSDVERFKKESFAIVSRLQEKFSEMNSSDEVTAGMPNQPREQVPVPSRVSAPVKTENSSGIGGLAGNADMDRKEDVKPLASQVKREAMAGRSGVVKEEGAEASHVSASVKSEPFDESRSPNCKVESSF